MGIEVSKLINKRKKIITLKDNYKKNLYIYQEELLLISYIKPNNILIAELHDISNYSITIREDELNGSLDMLIDQFTVSQKYYIIKSLYIAIYKLHELNIVNGNLKTSNVLINSDGEMYIDDYCINKIRNNKIYNYGDDIYNIGVIASILLRNDMIEMLNIAKGSYKVINYCRKDPLKNNSTLKELALIDSNLLSHNYILLLYNEVKYDRIMYNSFIESYNESQGDLKWLFYLIEYIWLNKCEYLKEEIDYLLDYNIRIVECHGKEIMLDKVIIKSVGQNYSLNISCIYINNY